MNTNQQLDTNQINQVDKANEQTELIDKVNQLLSGVVYSEVEIQEQIDNIYSIYNNIPIVRVCAYGRVSTKYKEQLSSLLTQHEVFVEYCRQNQNKGYVLVNEVYERKTATVKEKRPVFLKMIEDARAGLYDICLFKDSKRFSRNRTDYNDYTENLASEGVYLEFISERFNTRTILTSTHDRDYFSMLGMMNESHSNGYHDANKAAIRVQRKRPLGLVPGNIFGYHRHSDDTQYADIVEDQAKVIIELFERYVAGEGLNSISRDLIARGITTYSGNKPAVFALRRFIRNPLYKGLLIMNQYEKDSARLKRRKIPESEHIVIQREDLRIVSDELWNEANRIMDTNKKKQESYGCFKQSETDKLRTKLLAKKIVCGECGRNYNRKPSNHKDKTYTYLMCGYKKYNKQNMAGQRVCHNEKVLRLDSMISLFSLIITNMIKNKENLLDYIIKMIETEVKKVNSNLSNNVSDEDYKVAVEKFKRAKKLYISGDIDEQDFNEYKLRVKELEQIIKDNVLININKDDIEQLAIKFINNIENIIVDTLSNESVENSDNIKKFNSLLEKIVVYENHLDIIFKVFNKQLNRLNSIDISSELEEFNFLVPEVDNNISDCNLMDKNLTDEEKKKELRKIKEKLRRRRWRAAKKKRDSERNSSFIVDSEKAFEEMRTNQVVRAFSNYKINIYID